MRRIAASTPNVYRCHYRLCFGDWETLDYDLQLEDWCERSFVFMVARHAREEAREGQEQCPVGVHSTGYRYKPSLSRQERHCWLSMPGCQGGSHRQDLERTGTQMRALGKASMKLGLVHTRRWRLWSPIMGREQNVEVMHSGSSRVGSAAGQRQQLLPRQLMQRGKL